RVSGPDNAPPPHGFTAATPQASQALEPRLCGADGRWGPRLEGEVLCALGRSMLRPGGPGGLFPFFVLMAPEDVGLWEKAPANVSAATLLIVQNNFWLSGMLTHPHLAPSISQKASNPLHLSQASVEKHFLMGSLSEQPIYSVPNPASAEIIEPLQGSQTEPKPTAINEAGGNTVMVFHRTPGK
ncbi:hypothetical protein JOQ06_030039, partial [Pogonophryne albipinna]